MADAINRHDVTAGSFHVKSMKGSTLKFDKDINVSSVLTYSEARPKTVHTIRSSSGWRTPTAWAHSYTRIANPYVESYGEWSFGGWKFWQHGDTDNLQEWSLKGALPDLSKQVDLAINKALLKLSNQQTDLGENFAERKQADRMIGDRIDRYTSQLTGRYISHHRKDWRRVKEVSPFVRHGMKFPNSWLEFQYGVVPLLSDIYGAYQVLKKIDKDYDTFTATVKASSEMDTITTDRTVLVTPSYGADMPRGSFQIQRNISGFVYVRLDYNLVNPALAELQKVGLVNPVLLAWNLVPYSFVLDWALPVGNYLQAWTASLGWQFKGGTMTKVRRAEDRVTGYIKPAMVNGSGSYIPFNPSYCYDMVRTVFLSSPAPRLPHWKNPLTLGHTANALSLLATAFKKF